MSEHVRERLSAYLDRELAAAEDDAVLAHLRGCEACRSHLAALTSVDKAARALPALAPPGYFDTLPGRVRARLETASAGPAVVRLSRPTVRPPLRRLPAWTWAVAAALLLAVVVPITLREKRASLAPPPRPEAIPAAPTAPPMTLTGAEPGFAPAPAQEAARSDDVARRKARVEDLPIAAAGKLSAETVAGLQTGAEPKPAAPAYPAEARSAEVESGAVAGSPTSRAPTSSAAVAEKRQRTPGPGGPYAQSPSQQAQTQAPADQAADRAMVESTTEEKVDVDERARDKEEASPPRAKSARERDEQGPRGAGALANRVPPADEQEFSRLVAPAAQTAGALRARREAWRSFARLYPKSPRADEARVQVVETGAAAWRLGRDPRDRERVREDAAAYLDGKDAAQKARVHAVLENLEGR